MDVGTKKSPWTPGAEMGEVPDVATYVIELRAERFEIEDVVPIGANALNLSVGADVTFAVEKKDVYIFMNDGSERRARLLKRQPRQKR